MTRKKSLEDQIMEAITPVPYIPTECRCAHCGEYFGEAQTLKEELAYAAQARAHAATCPKHPLNEIQPCGHPARYVYPPTGDQGTTLFCAACLLDQYGELVGENSRDINALEARISELEADLASETSWAEHYANRAKTLESQENP